MKDTTQRPVQTKYNWRLDPYYIELKIEEEIKVKKQTGNHKTDATPK